MCGFSFEPALEAAHIVPWSEASKEHRLHPQNGILLCSLHHRLFDAALMTVSQSYKVVYYDPYMNDTPYSHFDMAATAALHGQKIYLPHDKRHWPAKAFLTKHHKLRRWGRLR
ncbi:HNH endonuclease [Microvirga sp. ACRRW]|uniref:HNH endonuclease n=1 Tax=Microvirga sp. ACRRW TaxID=2918205 RepID=UPI00351D7F86